MSIRWQILSFLAFVRILSLFGCLPSFMMLAAAAADDIESNFPATFEGAGGKIDAEAAALAKAEVKALVLAAVY